MSLRASSTHMVVSFLNELCKGLKSVDVVAKSWLRLENNKWMCYFPPKKDYPKIDDWVENNVSPKEDWIAVEVVIVKQARSYEDGLTYLEESFKTAEIESLPEKATSSKEMPKVMSAVQKDKILNILPDFPSPIRISPVHNGSSSNSSFDTTKQLSHTNSVVDADCAKSQMRKKSRPPTQEISKSKQNQEKHTRRPIYESSESDESSSHNDSDEIDFADTSRKRLSKHSKESYDDNVDHNQNNAPPLKRLRITNDKKNKSEDSETNPYIPLSKAMLEASEKKILKAISRAKRSVLYNIKQYSKTVRATITLSDGNNEIDLRAEIQESLKVQLPVQSYEEFAQLDEHLNDPTKIKIMRRFMCINMAANIKDAIAEILASIMTKDVQVLFSGQGRIVKGTGKKNFSATNTYACMQDLLKTKKKAETSAIKSLTSCWLSRAQDREGGRQSRSEK